MPLSATAAIVLPEFPRSPLTLYVGAFGDPEEIRIAIKSACAYSRSYVSRELPYFVPILTRELLKGREHQIELALGLPLRRRKVDYTYELAMHPASRGLDYPGIRVSESRRLIYRGPLFKWLGFFRIEQTAARGPLPPRTPRRVIKRLLDRKDDRVPLYVRDGIPYYGAERRITVDFAPLSDQSDPDDELEALARERAYGRD